ncbi:MAG: hypothetical protein PHH09_04035 [Methanoregulaceae archaeon]|nr:hypothetical protein [Methanoregulaceae archaeon]
MNAKEKTRDLGGLKNIRWICIKCGTTLTDTELKKLPKGDPIRKCPECGTPGWFLRADTVQEKIGGYLS